MDVGFALVPNQEAAAIIANKPPVAKRVFDQLLPEIRARAFTVAGIESANALQRIRDTVAAVPLGNQTWDESKKQIVDELEPYLGDGADRRADLVLRVNSFQAYSATIHNAGMADDDTVAFQYLHGECKVPTPSHLALNGVIVPKDDPFWETHTGPWGHLGCVCYKRPMNPDLVALEKSKDAKRNPDNRNVMEGPALTQLNHGTFIRDGKKFDVTIDGPDNSGFKWSPGDMKIPVKDLEAKYDPEVWAQFQAWAKAQPLDAKRSIWDWLATPGQNDSPSAASSSSPPSAPTDEPSALSPLVERFRRAEFEAPILATVAALPEAVAPLLNNLQIEKTKGGAHYSPSSDTIYVQGNPNSWSGSPAAVVHEIGHHLHYQTGTITNSNADPAFVSTAKSDWDKFEQWAEQTIGADWRLRLRAKSFSAVETIAKALGYTESYERLSLDDQRRITRFTDTIMGLSRGQYGFGHSISYMRANGLKEVFTHAWSALVDKDAEFIKLFSGVSDMVRKILRL